MTFILKQIFALLKLLNSDTGANQIAAGIACGLVLGFAPAFSLQTILIVFVLFFFRIQLGAATVAAIFFGLMAWLLDPISHRIGMAALEIESLRPLYTEMYNMPLVPLTRFYNSIVMGAGLLSIFLSIPVFFLSLFLIHKYRETIVARFKKSKIWKVIEATGIYKWYVKYQELY